MTVGYRPAAAEDFEFLYDLHKATMRAYVEQTWGAWDEPWQRQFFEQHYNPALLQIIQFDGHDVGVVLVQERNEEIFLARIEILPAYQGQGIGAKLIREWMDRAEQLGKPVALKVLKVNIKARHLYQRLGFGVTGEDNSHYIMAYEP